MNEDFEEWYKNYKQSGAMITAHKEKNEENCIVRYAGKPMELLFVLEEIIRELHKKIPKELLDITYEQAYNEVE